MVVVKAVVFGASGYAGVELVRILDQHPQLELVGASAAGNAGAVISELYPHLIGSASASMVLADTEALMRQVTQDSCDVVFLALPHNQAAKIAPKLLDNVRVVVDLSADFRLRDAELYASVYNFVHPAPELLADAVYGLVELNRSALINARLIAAPGCYVTAVTLALFPLLERGIIKPAGIIANAVSGVSGAGRGAVIGNLFGEVDSNVMAYGLNGHRHSCEINQNLGTEVLFVPHVVPMTRGILASCYADLDMDALGADSRAMGSKTLIQEEIHAAMSDFYAKEAYVSVLESGTSPRTKSTLGTNSAHISVTYDPATRKVIALCALDNMLKGASGQAVQAANLALGLAEDDGLAKVSNYP